MNLNNFLVSEDASLRTALSSIQSNQHGFILTTTTTNAVIALATDGDIRRKLIDGFSLDESISLCANSNFFWASPDTPREILLKRLDHKIRVIPILDKNRQLVGIVTKDHLPSVDEEPVYARARSPVRISFGGGGSDLTHYFANEGGAVINTTISLYSHATLRIRKDAKIIIRSLDLGESMLAENLKLALKQKGRFGLILSLLRVINPDFGFELYLHSDYPMNSGLGGSAVVSAAVLGCFNQFRRDQWNSHELAELAFQAERLYFGVAGGWQDQYATVFGGFNFIEFGMDQNIVHPLRINADILLELEENLILCDTGISHDSSEIHQDQRKEMQMENIRNMVKTNVELTYRIRNHLLRGRLLQFGQSIHEAWQLKRQFSSKITNSRLDAIYNDAISSGVVGGKLLGAGGGGFFLFYVPPFRKLELMTSLKEKGLEIHTFRFVKEGLRAWKVRESRNYGENEDS